jgi:hypothetical protein
MAIFNPNRTEGGTIKLVKDANGNYTTQEVGFNTLASLSIPDFKTTATTTTTTDTKTATDNTGDTITSQTQMAFKMPEGGDNNRIDTTGDMLQESAKKLSDSLQGVSTSTTIQDSMPRSEKVFRSETDRFKQEFDPTNIESPTERVFRSETDRFKQEFDPTVIDSTLAVDKDLKGSAAVQRGEIDPPGFNFDFLKGDRFKQGTAFSRPKEGTIDQMAANAMTRQEMISGATPDDPTANQLGVSTAKPSETALDMDRFKGVSKMGTLADKDVKDVKPVKKSALETISTSLKTTKDSILSKIKTPGMMLIDAIVGEPTAVQNHATTYFNDRGDGRIAGNPATDLYAGFNRVSAFGNLEKAGEKRIANREKTIARKGYKAGDKFYDDTQKMKDQQKSYKASLDKNVTTKREAARMNQPGAGGDKSGRSGGKIVCTMMNESYGFGSFRNKIWLRHSKNLAPEYQIGYHRIFLPLVKKAKTNKVLKKILEHIAIHRIIDIRQEERNKTHLLGRVYRTILEPICYWVGKI